MSVISETARANLAARRRRERRFRHYSAAAVAVAAAFLVFFLADMFKQSWPAYTQTFVRLDVTYSPEAADNAELALSEEDFFMASRGFVRTIPSIMAEHPELRGQTVSQWVLADADVDQFVKGRHSRLKPKDITLVQEYQRLGRIERRFNWGFFYNGNSRLPEMAGIFAAAAGTVYVLLLTLAFSFPVGVFSAVYLEEFAPDNRLTQLIEVNINNLAAIPSILYGLLGLAIFINFLGVPRSSTLVGGLTLALMTLPTIIIATRAALRSVPSSIREAAFGLGATGWQVVWHHTLPLSLPGILTGTIIGLARAIGETAPLIIVGMIAFIPQAPTSIITSATVLPAQIYTWTTDSQRAFTERTAAAIIVLLVIMLAMNALAIYLRNRYERKW